MNYLNKIVLGTAQIASNYGLNNKTKFSLTEKKMILSEGYKSGIRTIDTAIAYKNSEKVLGDIGVNNFDVITKIPTFSKSNTCMKSWIEKEIQRSLNRLNLNKLNGVLFHNPNQLRSVEYNDLFFKLKEFQEDGIVEKIGFSIYTLDQAFYFMENFEFQIFQVPYNIFDRRFEDLDFIRLCKIKKIEIHVRSIFLQGLLLMDFNEIPLYFHKWEEELYNWHFFLSKNNISRLQACLLLPLINQNISKIVIGIDNLEQLNELIFNINNLNHQKSELLSDSFSSSDLNLINPQNWNLK